jgi:chromosome segregation ATPase
MPILTFQLALVLVSCFFAGAIVTWMLQGRRAKSTGSNDEAFAWRSSSTRLEGIAQAVQSLGEKLDGLSKSWPNAHRNEAELEQTLKLHAHNPELWAIEREHHRALCEHAAQHSKQALRIAELMDQLEAVENTSRTIHGEYQELRARHDTAVANYGENDKASAAKIERLEKRVAEIEPDAARCAQLQYELDSKCTEWNERDAASKRQVEYLTQQVERLESAKERVQQLEGLSARNEQQLATSQQKITSLENELGATQQRARTLETRCTNLEQERDAAQKSLGESQTQLELSRNSCTSVQNQLAKATAEQDARWTAAQNELATTRQALQEERQRASDTAKRLEVDLESSNAQLAKSKAKLQHHSTHVEQAWTVLTGLKPMLEALEQKLKETEDAPQEQVTTAPTTPATPVDSSSFDLSVLDDKTA